MSKKKHKLKHKGSWEEKQIDQPNKGKFVITPEMQQEAADRFKDPIKKWIASDEIIKNDQAVKINPFDSNIIPGMPNYMVNPPKMYDVDPFPPLASPEQIEILNEAYLKMQQEAAGTSSVEDTSWIQTFSGRKFFPLNPFLDSIVIQDIAHALSMQCRFTGHTSQFYCVTPDTKILTDDLTWVPAGSLKLNDGLVGFDEHAIKLSKFRNRRKMKHSTVLHTGIIKRHVYAIYLSDGSVLKSSDEHPWLICSKKSRNQKWNTTQEIIDAIKDGRQRFFLKFLEPWSTPIDNYDIGYLSGIFDGEATMGCDRQGFTLSVAQNPGPVMEKIKYTLTKLNFNYAEYSSKDKKCRKLQLIGTWFDRLRFLGIINPIRLKQKYQKHLKSNNWRKEFDSIKMLSVTKIEDLGMQDVVALETSSRTYFAEGFGSHNSISQHSVLVSYLCDPIDSLWGLLHDSSEAYLTDLASPLKRSGKFQDYVECEKKLQVHICQRFGLSEIEPESVKRADKLLLSMEARDLMGPLHSDWKMNIKPLPFTITPLPPLEAEKLFLDRFDELFGAAK